MDRGSEPVRHFMLKFVREKDAALFVEMAKLPPPRSPEDLPMRVVAPAYILSELKVGFQIGAVLFLPFLVIDLVVASITTSVGMLQLPPVVISTPIKILLFVMVDGWNLLVGSLMKSFYVSGAESEESDVVGNGRQVGTGTLETAVLLAAPLLIALAAGQPADQRRAGADLVAGQHHFQRAPAAGDGGRRDRADALDAAQAVPVHLADVCRLPAAAALADRERAMGPRLQLENWSPSRSFRRSARLRAAGVRALSGQQRHRAAHQGRAGGDADGAAVPGVRPARPFADVPAAWCE